MPEHDILKEVFQRNLKRLLSQKQTTQKDLAEYMKVSPVTVNDWIRGRKLPRMDKVDRLCEYFNVPRSALMEKFSDSTQSPAPAPDDLPALNAKDGTFPLNDTHRVPIIGTVRCGPGGLAYEHIDEYMTIDASYNPAEMRGFRAEGDSMIGDGIYDGDLCLIRLQPEIENGAIAVVVIDREEGCLKHVTIDKTNGVVVLSSSNPAYPQRVFTGLAANDVRIVGKLIEVRHRF
ncbi:MAG: LexA family transcriptional regulator [Schwartzia sp. (in: firmicutes)]